MSIIKKLIRKEIKNTLNELKFDDIAKQFKDQRSSNFYHHQDHLDFMQKEKNKFPSFIEFKNGIIHFQHESSEEWKETQDETYDQFIKFYEWKNVPNLVNSGKNSKEITDLLYSGDLGVYCSCKSFHYHYSYTASQKQADVSLQKIASPITNPQLKGIGCKHLDALFNKSALKFNFSLIKREIDKFQKTAAKKAVKKILHKNQSKENNTAEPIVDLSNED